MRMLLQIAVQQGSKKAAPIIIADALAAVIQRVEHTSTASSLTSINGFGRLTLE